MTLDDLSLLQQTLIRAKTADARKDILAALPSVRTLLQKNTLFSRCIEEASSEMASAMMQLAAIGQGFDPEESSFEKWLSLAQTALEIDRFYREIGGIVGYQASVLQMLQKTDEGSERVEHFHSPKFQDLSKPTEEVAEWIYAGIAAMPYLAELYPLGGAADRLHLVDAETGLELPAAKLPFAGRTLFETLLRDLVAREWLYFCLFGEQITTPVAVMTSSEKDNHRHVLKICEENAWFGRDKESFRLFLQPLVPAVDEKGNWYTTASCKPLLKPGGHGAVWKLARDEGVFAWLRALGRKKALVRQINNPIAGIDYGLIAFVGIGALKDMSFGFASCNRRVLSAEGIVVLKEQDDRVALTNIEYCDFAKKGILDEPASPEGLYSKYSSNTNILFADLEAVERAVTSHPFPGLLMNLKLTHFAPESGPSRQVLLGRLESTMQNISDAFHEPKRQDALEMEKTFVTYNLRHKTISVAKKAFVPGQSLMETPECCFYELLQASRQLLASCGFTLPISRSLEEYMQKGPDCAFLYHPALGPLYEIIQQKLRGGRVGLESEIYLEIAELDAENLEVDGSFRLLAEQVVGKRGADGVLRYSQETGQCILRNVQIRNLGVAWQGSPSFWQMELKRRESLEITLKGCSCFEAEGVVFEGAYRFVVEDGMRMVVRQIDGKIVTRQEPFSSRGLWRYTWDKGVLLNRMSGK